MATGGWKEGKGYEHSYGCESEEKRASGVDPQYADLRGMGARAVVIT